jgi:L-lactate dehydrogenase complex protein LldF
MEPTTKDFKKTAAAALANEPLQASLSGLYDGLHQARITTSEATPNWEEMRDRGRAIRDHTIANLDHYLELAERNVIEAGGHVFFAKDADAAAEYVLELARSKDAKLVVKGKSMLSEEMGLNKRLEDQGVEPVETDLGEFIIQLADETPFHIIAPAIHKTKDEVSGLFQEKLGSPWYDEPTDLTQEARRQLRKKFLDADMGITGANFLVAETGTLVLVTNEGNGRMCTSMPKVHVAIMGMEKVVPSMDDLGTMLPLLIRSATGQRISSYVTFINGPRGADEEDGPEEFHLVIVDNGRSRLLADPELRESLNCIRCAACLNACPVYRKVGGHAYGWVYSGPIGAVISPVLTNVPDAKDLPYASSLCGACREVCPVKINIPRMLLYLRHQLAEGAQHPENKNVTLGERLAMKGWRLTLSSTLALGLANRVARLLQWPLARGGRLRWLPPPLSAWTRHRSFPALVRPFRDRWKRLPNGSESARRRR